MKNGDGNCEQCINKNYGHKRRHKRKRQGAHLKATEEIEIINQRVLLLLDKGDQFSGVESRELLYQPLTCSDGESDNPPDRCANKLTTTIYRGYAKTKLSS